jgi:hypothetical protein
MPFSPLQALNLSAVAAYPTNPQVDLSTQFLPDGYVMQALTAAGDAVVRISFDGITDHLELRNSLLPFELMTTASKVWCRRVSGTNPTTLNINGKTDR